MGGLINIENKMKLSNAKKLLEIQKLEDGWDGLGAKKIRRKTIINTEYLIKYLNQQPDYLSPLTETLIRLEFCYGSKQFEIYVHNNKIIILFDNNDKNSITFEGDCLAKLCVEYINKIIIGEIGGDNYE